uniref:Integrase core domain containing protein n=1 Tax=Solanum tuberosum TaxID=4113 RepID=M1DX05_SOLTU
MLTEKEKIARLVTEEHRVLTGSLHTMPDIHQLFQKHKCEWMAPSPGAFGEERVREFYASYAATLRGSIDRRSKPATQAPLTATLVHGFSVDISETTIRKFLYGPSHTLPINTTKFDYRWDIIRSGAFQRNADQRETLLRWLARHLTTDGERAELVSSPHLGIKKSTLTFVAKLFWLLVRNWVSPTQADNVLTWDCTVMVAALVAGMDINFARILIAEIHKRAFKATTTLPFPCFIFHLCRDIGVPVWHCEKLVQATKTLDIGLIRDEANKVAPRREPPVEVPPLGADLVADVEQKQGEEPSPPVITEDAPISHSPVTNQAPISSRSTPSSGFVIVPLARVQKLEAQMATLLEHMRLWMQRSIVESEARMDQQMEHMMDQKVQVVHKFLDAFELRVLERPATTVDVTTLQKEVESLCADITGLFAPPETEPESSPTAPVDNTVLGALFIDEMLPPASSRHVRKCPRSSQTSDDTEAGRDRKRHRQEHKEARRASIVDEAMH